MQARLRRNRVAVLVAMALCLTCTGSIQSEGTVSLRSGAADIAYAATMGSRASALDGQDIAGDGSDQNGNHEAYDTEDWWKAQLKEYDDSLSLTSYEAAFTEPDKALTTTNASDKSDSKTTGTSTSEEAAVSTLTTVAEPAATARTQIVAEPGTVVFYSSGYGHGVGMSQNGANFYAKYDGWTYDRILQFYYPGTYIVQTGTPETELMTVGGKTDNVVSILSQIVYNEMGSYFNEEALKAQAVAAYTFYLYNGYGAGMICKANPPQNVVDCVRSVLGQVVYYDGAPALTMFTASSGGATASCRDVFFMDIPYLVSFPVRHDDTSDPHYCSTKTFTASSLKAKLESAYKVKLTGSPNDWIQLELGDGGYVAYAVIGGSVRVKGNALRAVLGLKSPKFGFVYSEGGSSGVVGIQDPLPDSSVEPSSVPEIIVAYTEPVAQMTTTAASTTTTTTTVTETEAQNSESDSETVSSAITDMTEGTTSDSSDLVTEPETSVQPVETTES